MSERRVAVAEFVGFVVLALYMRKMGYTPASVGLRRVNRLKAILLLIPQTILACMAILGTGLAVGFGGEALGLATSITRG